MKKLAVYTDTEDLDPAEGIDLLTKNDFEVVRLETKNGNEIINAAKDAAALLVGYAPITEEIIEKLPKLKIVSMLSTGYDNVDLNALKKRNIELATLGALPAEEVASHTAAITLGMIRGVPAFQEVARSKEWFQTPHPVMPPRISNLTLGIMGFGRIGKLIGEFLKPQFNKVIFYDPFIPESPNSEIEKVDFDKLVQTSDVVVLSLPATKENRHLINETVFKKMKKNSYFVNTARGSLVDTSALLSAIESGHLAGAALDVLDEEPPKLSNPILHNEKVLVTPHVAYLSSYTNSAYIRVQAENVINFFANGRGN